MCAAGKTADSGQAVFKQVKKLCYAAARSLFSNRVKMLLHRLYLTRVRRQAPRLHRRQVAMWRKIKEKPAINVVFEMYHLGFWKSESVFRLMQRHARFSPVVWIVPHYDTWDNAANAQACREYCERMGFPYVIHKDLGCFGAAEYPDILLPPEQYAFNFFRHYHRCGKPLLNHAICLVPYCYRNTTDSIDFNELLQNIALFNFCENSYIAGYARGIMDNGGCNLAVTGNPISDLFAEAAGRRGVEAPAWKNSDQTMKRLIWAPHWTIKNVPGYYCASTFLQVHDTMLQMAEKYADRLQIAFKPHPGLYNELCQHPEWGKERTDAYYAKWREMPNTQLEEGQYINLFVQSDALIHDSGSFIIEYLFTGKPCMYLQVGEGFGHFNRMNEEALECHERGMDVEGFILNTVLGGDDKLQTIRQNFRERYLQPPGGRSAAENIVATLLGEDTQAP